MSGVTGAPVSTLAIPNPLVNTMLSPLTTATAAPGVFDSFNSSATTRSRSLKSREGEA